MTDLPSGNTRTSPIAGSLDGFDTDLRTALARLDRERRSSFARPGQRAEALERFTGAVTKALGKVRGQDRVAALADRKDALDRAAVSTAKTITALERQLAKTVAECGELREALADAAGERSKLRLDLAAADKRIAEQEDELTETQAAAQELRDALAGAQGQLAMARDPLTDAVETNARILARRDAAPEVTLEAPAPPLPRRNGPRSRASKPVSAPGTGTHTSATPSTPKPSESRTAAQDDA